jgi:glycosyltransferase involved in cell wall biosynthesis
VVPPDDPEALAGAILRLYDPGTRELLIRNVAVEKHRYSWGSMVRAVEEMAGI